MSFGDFLGWWLAFLLPLLAFVGPLRRDQGAAHAYLLALFLHIAAAAIYVYVPGVLPVRGDAIGFHRIAVSLQVMTEWPFGLSSQFYRWVLAHIYSWVGPSFFFAAVLSVFAFALSAIVLAKLMELLDIRKNKAVVIFLFGALPTAVLYGSVPLREPYQVLFFMLACYSMLRFRLSSQPLHLLAAMLFAFMMGLLHKGLILYAPFLIMIMLLVRVDHPQQRSARRVYLHRFAAVALAVSFVVWISGAAQKLEGVGGAEVLITATTGEGLVDLAEGHRDEEALSKGRTAYGVALNTSSPVQFLYSFVMIFSYYMFAPFPWQVRNFLDVYAFGEVILRVACLVAIFRMWRQRGLVHPQIVTLLMVVYFSMAFLWAAGTTTYGTATRHHMIHQWILLLLGVPALLQIYYRSAAGGFAARPAGAPSAARSPGARVQAHTPQRTSLAASLSIPPRLGFERRAARARQMTASAAPRPWSEGPRRLRGLAAVPRRLSRG